MKNRYASTWVTGVLGGKRGAISLQDGGGVAVNDEDVVMEDKEKNQEESECADRESPPGDYTVLDVNAFYQKASEGRFWKKQNTLEGRMEVIPPLLSICS